MTDDPAADLHLHTTASDGTDTVAERIQQAHEHGLDAIAITDHDTIDDEIPERSEFRGGLEVIAGVEVRADLFETKIELLGYFIDPTSSSLNSVLERARQYRVERNEEILDHLEVATGEGFAYDEIATRATGVLGRPHIADELVDRGLTGSVGEAFETYLADGGAAFVPMERVPAGKVLDAIQDAGGVASLAHPGRIRSTEVPEMVDTLAERGLDAIEVWYPYESSGPGAYADVGVEEAEVLAEDHGLLKTGGSDCHGRGSGKFRIGTVGTPDEEFQKLSATVTTD